MARIAVTGHRCLPPDTAEGVRSALREALRDPLMAALAAPETAPRAVPRTTPRAAAPRTTPRTTPRTAPQTTQCGRLVGLSCLADGADQIFAAEILRAGGRLHAIIPATRYRDSLPEQARRSYDDLITVAHRVHHMPYELPNPESFMAASVFMLQRADALFAVWDGLPARGFGGTADVVAHARRHGIEVRVLWPPGSRRD